MSDPWFSPEDIEAQRLDNMKIGEGMILLGLILFAIMVTVIS